MYNKFVEQSQSFVKPLGELAALNVKAIEQLIEKQSALFSGVLNDGVTYAKDLAEQKDIAGVYNTQKAYFEGVQDKVVTVAKDVYSVVTEAQDKVGEVMKSAVPNFKPGAKK
ncbi:MAG: phasin family protein [Exilibacterium sp.]